jgi:hypothetical protein
MLPDKIQIDAGDRKALVPSICRATLVADVSE